MPIPLVDLKAQYQTIKPEIDTAIQTVINEASFIKGPHLAAFEKNFAKACQANYCVGVSNGTTALEVALRILGIGSGAEVILPVNTFMATLEAVVAVGAKPILVDCEANTANIDVQEIPKKISNLTKALLPVHLYGRPVAMDQILAIAKANNLKVIEDCAQAHLAEFNGKRVPLGDIGGFSFFPGKNLGAYGDAGAIVTNDPELAGKARKISDHGRISKYEHDQYGFNYRMDAIQAAILSVKLKYLEQWTARRRAIAQLYSQLLAGVCQTPAPETREKHVYHLYVIQTGRRDALQTYLKEQGIETGVHYPLPLHLQPACQNLNYRLGDFPNAEKQAEEILSLPIYPEMTDEQVKTIASRIKEFLNR